MSSDVLDLTLDVKLLEDYKECCRGKFVVKTKTLGAPSPLLKSSKSDSTALHMEDTSFSCAEEAEDPLLTSESKGTNKVLETSKSSTAKKKIQLNGKRLNLSLNRHMVGPCSSLRHSLMRRDKQSKGTEKKSELHFHLVLSAYSLSMGKCPALGKCSDDVRPGLKEPQWTGEMIKKLQRCA